MKKFFIFPALMTAVIAMFISGSCGETTSNKTATEHVEKTDTDTIPPAPQVTEQPQASADTVVQQVEPVPTPGKSTNKPVESKSVQVKKVEQKPKPAVSTADIAEGKRLLATSDCLACHKVDVKIVGPSYVDVAKKYPATEANYNALAAKIISGGSGTWGKIPMTPHPTLSNADAKKMVMYILSLN